MAMLDRIAGNRELKQHLKTALACGRLAHSILLVGEPGCGAGFALGCSVFLGAGLGASSFLPLAK